MYPEDKHMESTLIDAAAAFDLIRVAAVSAAETIEGCDCPKKDACQLDLVMRGITVVTDDSRDKCLDASVGRGY